jgi:RimJ/RimL family protein N-acetyltransferase
MEIKHITHPDLELPPPIFTAKQVAQATAMSGQSFTIFVGWSKDIVADVKAHSLDQADTKLQVTSDRKRFGEGPYEAWYAKQRVPFALIDNATGGLAAIAWLGPKPLGRKSVKRLSAAESVQDERTLDAENWATIVYRSYKPFRGKGLMTDFVRFAMEYYLAKHPRTHFWAGLDTKNPASQALAEQLGFRVSEEASDREAHWLVMVRE